MSLVWLEHNPLLTHRFLFGFGSNFSRVEDSPVKTAITDGLWKCTRNTLLCQVWTVACLSCPLVIKTPGKKRCQYQVWTWPQSNKASVFTVSWIHCVFEHRQFQHRLFFHIHHWRADVCKSTAQCCCVLLFIYFSMQIEAIWLDYAIMSNFGTFLFSRRDFSNLVHAQFAFTQKKSAPGTFTEPPSSDIIWVVGHSLRSSDSDGAWYCVCCLSESRQCCFQRR